VPSAGANFPDNEVRVKRIDVPGNACRRRRLRSCCRAREPPRCAQSDPYLPCVSLCSSRHKTEDDCAEFGFESSAGPRLQFFSAILRPGAARRYPMDY
jgi:hypothetical protein